MVTGEVGNAEVELGLEGLPRLESGLVPQVAGSRVLLQNMRGLRHWPCSIA